MNKVTELLKELTAAHGVSGSEENICDLLCEMLKLYGEVSRDSMNNVYCTFGQGYHFMLDAHLDEIGFVVTEITDDGFIKFDKCGGIDTRSLPANEVSIWGTQEIKGIISTLPPHLQNDEDSKNAPKISDLSIDTGLRKDELEKIVGLGDKITFKRNFNVLLNNRVSGTCLDDRAGVCAILLALDKLKNLPCKVTVMFSSQEEVGTRGAKIGPYSRNVDEAIAIDVSFAYTPTCDKKDCGEISNGVMIGFSPILNREMSKKLVSTAKKRDIPYQIEVMNGSTGTNADVISVSECGIKTALLSIPQKYMHQSVEIIDISDVESVSELICAYISERVGEINA